MAEQNVLFRPAIDVISENLPTAEQVQSGLETAKNVALSSPQELYQQYVNSQNPINPNSPLQNPPADPTQMDAETQKVILGAANPPEFQAQQNPMSNVPPQPEEQNVYPSDLQAQKPVSVMPESDPFAGINAQMGAQKDLNAATQTLEKSRQQQLAKTEEIQNQRVMQFEQMSKKYNLELDTRMKAIDDSLKQVESDAINARKSSADLFHEKSTGQKVAAGLAMILGVAHAGLGGGNGGNMGVQLIEQSLEKDRQNNLYKYSQSKEMLNLKRQNADDYAENMARHEAIVDKQTLMQMQLIETKLKQAESIYRGSAASANAKNALGMLTMQKDQLKAQIAQREALNNMLQSGDLSELTPLQTMGLPENVRKAIEQTRELKVPGYGGVALSKEDRDQFQKFRQEQEPVINAINRVLKIQNSDQYSKLSPEQRGQVNSEIQMLIGGLRSGVVGPGAVSDKERAILVETIGNPNTLFSKNSWERAKLLTVLNKTKADLNTIAKARGLTPPKEFSGNFKTVEKGEADKIMQKYFKK